MPGSNPDDKSFIHLFKGKGHCSRSCTHTHTHTQTYTSRVSIVCTQGHCSLSKTIRKVLCRIVSPDNTDLPFDFSNRDEERRKPSLPPVSSVLNPWNGRGGGHRLIHPSPKICFHPFIYIAYAIIPIYPRLKKKRTLVTIPRHPHYFVRSFDKKEEKFPVSKYK